MTQLSVTTPTLPPFNKNSPLSSLYSPAGRYEVITTLNDHLEGLDITGQLADELMLLVNARVGYLKLTPGFDFPIKTGAYEGRGIYAPGNTYIKGCGAVQVACGKFLDSHCDSYLSRIPAFSFGNKPFFDPDNGLPLRRVWGALSIEGAHTEFMVAAAKLATIIKEQGINNLSKLMSYHMPIPIGVAINHDISDGIKEAIKRYYQENHSEDKSNVEGMIAENTRAAYGVVGVYMPSNERALRSPFIDFKSLEDPIGTEKKFLTFGDAIRFDLKLGWTFDARGAHLQNAIQLPYPFTGGRAVDFSDQFPVMLAASILLHDKDSLKSTNSRIKDMDTAVEVILASVFKQCLMMYTRFTTDYLPEDQINLHSYAINGFIEGLTGRKLDAESRENLFELLLHTVNVENSKPGEWFQSEVLNQHLVLDLLLLALARFARTNLIAKDPYLKRIQHDSRLLNNPEMFSSNEIAKKAIEGYTNFIRHFAFSYDSITDAADFKAFLKYFNEESNKIHEASKDRRSISHLSFTASTSFDSVKEQLCQSGIPIEVLEKSIDPKIKKLIDTDIQFLHNAPSELLPFYVPIVRSLVELDFLCTEDDKVIWDRLLKEAKPIAAGDEVWDPAGINLSKDTTLLSCPTSSAIILLNQFFKEKTHKVFEHSASKNLLVALAKECKKYSSTLDNVTSVLDTKQELDEDPTIVLFKEIKNAFSFFLFAHQDTEAYHSPSAGRYSNFIMNTLAHLLIQKFNFTNPEIVDQFLSLAEQTNGVRSAQYEAYESFKIYRLWAEIVELSGSNQPDTEKEALLQKEILSLFDYVKSHVDFMSKYRNI